MYHSEVVIVSKLQFAIMGCVDMNPVEKIKTLRKKRKKKKNTPLIFSPQAKPTLYFSWTKITIYADIPVASFGIKNRKAIGMKMQRT